MRETHPSIVWPFVRVVVPAIIGLGVLNALPQFVGGEPLTVVRYDSVEQLQDRLRVSVWRPTRIPGPWSWPPSRVRLATADHDWVQMVFEPRGSVGGRLVICQTLAAPRPRMRQVLPLSAWPLEPNRSAETRVPSSLLPAGEALQEIEILVHDRPARLRRLLLDNDNIVHELWWSRGTRLMMLRLDGSGDRLSRLADTIVEDRP